MLKKIAIVHDYLNQLGGAERVVSVLHEIFPKAPIYTSIYDKNKMPEIFKKMDIRTSFMQKIPFIMRFYRWFFWLYPLAFESFNFDEYDLIISSNTAFAKGIKKRYDAIHVCYCHNPARFIWETDNYIMKWGIPNFIKKLFKYILAILKLKEWDIKTNKNIDYFIANGKVAAEKIRKYYGREAKIINPPVETGFFNVSNEDRNYYLSTSRLIEHKRVDIAVDAFSRLGYPLKITGKGPAKEALENKAANNIEFLGDLDNEELKRLYSECRALIFTEEADFGMSPVEAQASGRPVIAYKKGGTAETIIDGKTGVFFEEQTPESLIDAVKRFEKMRFDKKTIREHALKFDKLVFKEKFLKFIKGLNI